MRQAASILRRESTELTGLGALVAGYGQAPHARCQPVRPGFDRGPSMPHPRCPQQSRHGRRKVRVSRFTVSDRPYFPTSARPCPFYSQGRCLFADSCNFLHEAKIKAAPTHHPSVDDAELDPFLVSSSPVDSSLVSAPFLASQTPTSPRSPRMTSLLTALEAIIGPDITPAHIEGVQVASSPRDPRDLVTTAVDEDETVTLPLSNRAPAYATHYEVTTSSGLNSAGLLSPVNLAQGPPIPFPPQSIPFPPQSPAIREDSIDSGYAESWVGPTPFALSPPTAYRPTSTLDLLSSPFGSPSTRVLPQNLGAMSPQFRPQTPSSKGNFSVSVYYD